MKNLFKICSAMLFLLWVAPAAGQVWIERLEPMPRYDLSGRKILMVVGHDYDHHEVYDIRALWESWGAKVVVTAPERITQGHIIEFTGTQFDRQMSSNITSDVVLSKAMINGFDALYFPGGQGPDHLVEHHAADVHRLLDSALRKGIPVVSICGGPLVFTLHDQFRGKRITASPAKQSVLQQFGAEFVYERVTVTENIVTGNWPYFDSFSVAVAHKILHPEATYDEIFPASCPILHAMCQQAPVQVFSAQPVAAETLETLIRAGLTVPVVQFNNQAWKFFAVESPGVRESIKNIKLNQLFEGNSNPANEQQVRNFWGRYLDHPVLIIGMRQKAPDVQVTPGQLQQFQNYQNQAVLMAAGQMALAAHSRGLGIQLLAGLDSVQEQISEILEAGDELEYVFSMAVGYPAVQQLPPVRKPLDEVLQRL